MVLCYPGEVTRIKMKFDKAGRYVWHCHILAHEDSEMTGKLFRFYFNFYNLTNNKINKIII